MVEPAREKEDPVAPTPALDEGATVYRMKLDFDKLMLGLLTGNHNGRCAGLFGPPEL